MNVHLDEWISKPPESVTIPISVGMVSPPLVIPAPVVPVVPVVPVSVKSAEIYIRNILSFFAQGA